MIIDFSISNFRSIREKQVFSLEAYLNKRDNSLLDNKVDFSLKGFKGAVLKGAALYGANASGKSNLFLGLKFFTDIALYSFQFLKPEMRIPIETFALDDVSKDMPSEFEINFILENIRYSYKLSLNSVQILSESLEAYPKGLPQRWFSREWDSETKKYSFEKSAYFKADSDIAEKTRLNSTYLSCAVVNNTEMLKPVYKYLSSIAILSGNQGFPPLTELLLSENKSLLSEIKKFMQFADLGIEDVVVEKNYLTEEEQKSLIKSHNFITGDISSGSPIVSEPFDISVDFLHNGYNGKQYKISQLNESDGTQKIFNYVAPFVTVLKQGLPLFIDEIDTSLHPLIVIELLKLFFDPEKNQNGAQIIFTTHNPIFLDADVIRRDQVWFSAKNSVGETILYSLLEYSPRKKESLLNGYLGGRYGAIPFFDKITKTMDLL